MKTSVIYRPTKFVTGSRLLRKSSPQSSHCDPKLPMKGHVIWKGRDIGLPPVQYGQSNPHVQSNSRNDRQNPGKLKQQSDFDAKPEGSNQPLSSIYRGKRQAMLPYDCPRHKLIILKSGVSSTEKFSHCSVTVCTWSVVRFKEAKVPLKIISSKCLASTNSLKRLTFPTACVSYPKAFRYSGKSFSFKDSPHGSVP